MGPGSTLLFPPSAEDLSILDMYSFHPLTLRDWLGQLKHKCSFSQRMIFVHYLLKSGNAEYAVDLVKWKIHSIGSVE